MYVAGYVIECLLKTQLMRMFDCRHLRELEQELQRRGVLAVDATVFTHHLEVLLRLVQGLERLRKNQALWQLFNIVNRWLPAWRYTADQANPGDAEDFLDAVQKDAHWIETNT
jgi:hypothetical protein